MTGLREYIVTASRRDDHGSVAGCKEASIELDTDTAGRKDAFNPAELFLASLAACMLKSLQRIIPMIHFDLDGASVKLHGFRQDSPPQITSITYELIIDTAESDHRLELLHRNILKYGTISNTIALACPLTGTIKRAGE